MHHDKPLKQSLAIAYAMKRKAQHKAHGGDMCEHGGEEHCMEGCYAEGGNVESGNQRFNNEKGVNKAFDASDSSGMSMAGLAARSATGSTKQMGNRLAKQEHEKVLSQLKKMPKPNLYAEGGEVDGHEDEEMHPMIKKILMGRMKGYSEGGMVANENSGESASEPDEMAKWKENEFDDLALDDHLEFDASGANEGDELGDEQEDEDRHDIVSKIMKSRSKRDRMAVSGEGSSYGKRK